MNRAVKITLITVVSLIVLFIIAIIVTLSIVNPNNYKNRIENTVYNETGRQLKIKGDIKWSLFPLGISVNQLSLSNQKSFNYKQFADINEARITLKLWPLFTGHIDFKNIIIKHAKFLLITNKQGRNNLQGWTAIPSSATNTAIKTTKTISPSTKSVIKQPKSSLNISIRNLQIKDSAAQIINEQNNTKTDITNFNLSANGIQPQQPVKITTNFNVHSKQSKNITKVSMTSQGHYDQNKQVLTMPKIRLNIITLRPSLPTIPLTVNGSALVNLKQNQLKLSPINIQVANLAIKANIIINHFNQIPDITLNVYSKSTDLHQFLTNLLGKSPFSGTLSFSGNFQTTGNSQQEYLENLSGSGKLNISDGIINGVDLTYMLGQAAALLKLTPKPYKPKSITTFSKLSGTYMITKGILVNNNLKLEAGEFDAIGKGSVNLPKNHVDYVLTATYLRKGSEAAPFKLPIIIRGSFNNLSYTPDFSIIGQQILSKELRKRTNTITKQIGKKINWDNLFH